MVKVTAPIGHDGRPNFLFQEHQAGGQYLMLHVTQHEVWIEVKYAFAWMCIRMQLVIHQAPGRLLEKAVLLGKADESISSTQFFLGPIGSSCPGSFRRWRHPHN